MLCTALSRLKLYVMDLIFYGMKKRESCKKIKYYFSLYLDILVSSGTDQAK